LTELVRAAFLDRDGVINESFLKNGIPSSPSSITELRIISGVEESIKNLKQHGYLPVVITNQPDVSRGKLSPVSLDGIHTFLAKKLGIDHFYICPHDDMDNCECRKPKPGMLQDAASELKIDLAKSFLVGDRWKDIEAGHLAGVRSYFIDYSYPESRPKYPHTRVFSLFEAVELELGANYER
jgi:D-glycero-D-manno-heptose 1,7-bisphosphate phosphatase